LCRSFYIPFKKVRNWAWETYWLVNGFFSWVIMPWLIVFLTIPNFASVLYETQGSTMFRTYLCGLLWGIGGLTFGLSMRYLGMSLGYAIALGLTAAFWSGFAAHALLLGQQDFPLLAQAYDILQNHALTPLPATPAMEYGMIRGMLQTYGDPYTQFIEPVQHELQTDDLQGRYGGIGVQLDFDLAGEIVVHPFPGGPAAEAGIASGDRLLEVDDQPVDKTRPLPEVEAALRGPEGSRVRVVIFRERTGETRQFKIERVPIPLPSVTWYPVSGAPQVGVVAIMPSATASRNQ